MDEESRNSSIHEATSNWRKLERTTEKLREELAGLGVELKVAPEVLYVRQGTGWIKSAGTWRSSGGPDPHDQYVIPMLVIVDELRWENLMAEVRQDTTQH